MLRNPITSVPLGFIFIGLTALEQARLVSVVYIGITPFGRDP